MQDAGATPADLIPEVLQPQAASIVRALRAFDEAEALMRGRFRSLLGVGSTDLAALRYIRSREAQGDPARGTDLRRRLGVSSAAATTITNRLTAAGFIEKPRDPTDKRARVFHLTDEARVRIDAVLGDTEHRLDEVLTAISEEEAERIVTIVDAATAVINDAGRGTA
jgi:DNA-binding MarR family transcriptional regulator